MVRIQPEQPAEDGALPGEFPASPRLLLVLVLALGPGPALLAGAPAPVPVVEAEEEVYSYVAADNGAGPLWCHGSTCIVRRGDDVFASGIETISDAKPLNNVRWMLFHRGQAGWKLVLKDPEGRTREPCPLAVFDRGPLFLSVNPTVAPRSAYSGPAEPRVLKFSAAAIEDPFETLLPAWEGKPPFTEHSYRSLAADGARGELVLFNNIDYTHAEWAFLNSQGTWAARGKLAWPHGAEYPKPQPIRVCYPTVALAGRAVHFCGVSDILEPYPHWREFKKQITGRDWDYDFRRLFYAWTRDITSGKFEDWIEVSSRDKTCGWIFPCDLWVAPDGAVHVLWSERAIDERLRAKFFPDARQRIALEHAVLREGKVVSRSPVLELLEGKPGETPGNGRFQATEDGRLFVVFHVSGSGASGQAATGNRIVEILPDGSLSASARIPLKAPFTSFFTATPRAGSRPSRILDILGEGGKPSTIRYARVRLDR